MTDVRARYSGQYTEETADDHILTAIRDSEFPAVTARWVSDTLGGERLSAHQRLSEGILLHETLFRLFHLTVNPSVTGPKR